jgi:Alcohol dehydrogenase GroES-like domain
MSRNRGVVYTRPGEVQVQDIADPKFENPQGRKIEHGVILKVVSTNICGSDQHMVRGRTTAPAGMVLGHEITGEVIEKGSDVEMLELGDLVSVPFNVACGRCRSCRETHTGVCLTVNPGRAGGAYGYVDMGGWIGGQARYVMIPYADFNLLKFPDKDQALSKIMDLTMLTDILPTGFHGALNAGVKPVEFPPHRADARPALQSATCDGVVERPPADREDRQCQSHQSGGCAEGLCRIRQGHCRQIRARSARRVGNCGLTILGWNHEFLIRKRSLNPAP